MDACAAFTVGCEHFTLRIFPFPYTHIFWYQMSFKKSPQLLCPGRQTKKYISIQAVGATSFSTGTLERGKEDGYSPRMHEDVRQVAPRLCSELWVINQGILQVPWMGHLQHKLIQRHSIVEEKGNLDESTGRRGPITKYKTAQGPSCAHTWNPCWKLSDFLLRRRGAPHLPALSLTVSHLYPTPVYFTLAIHNMVA